MSRPQDSSQDPNLLASRLMYHYVKNNEPEKLQGLVDKNGDGYALDLDFQYNGVTALGLAMQNGYDKCKEILVNNQDLLKAQEFFKDNGFLIKDTNDIMYSLRGEDKNTALHIASEQGNEEMVGYLLEKGAIINAGNNNGETPLILAAKNGRMDVVDTLIDSLAQKSDISQPDSPLNYCDVTGRTAYMWASENGHKNVTSLLKERGARTDFAEMAQEKPASSVSAGDDGLTTVIVDGKSTKRNFSIP